MDRRQFLQNSSLLGLSGLLAACGNLGPAGPVGPLASLVQAPRAVDKKWAGASPNNILVLVELNGGNDGLNTIIPYSDRLYTRLRPQLAVPREQVKPINDQLAFNAGLVPLLPAWEDAELAVVLGVGYPAPNRSHFRSIEIWDTASSSEEYLAEGWASRVLTAEKEARSRPAEAIVLGRPSVGPLVGGARVVVLENPQSFAKSAQAFQQPKGKARNPALAFVVETQAELRQAGDALQASLKRAPNIKTPFPKNSLGSQLANASRLIGSGLNVPLIKVSHGSYDTHAYERGTHDRLIAELGQALAAFRDSLKEQGLWDRVLVMTYSEFGRRVAENASQGTDHGTAAPLFIMGKAVKGGLYGAQPPLNDLTEGDLRYQVDFRSVYATMLKRWWARDPAVAFGKSYPDVGFLA